MTHTSLGIPITAFLLAIYIWPNNYVPIRLNGSGSVGQRPTIFHPRDLLATPSTRSFVRVWWMAVIVRSQKYIAVVVLVNGGAWKFIDSEPLVVEWGSIVNDFKSAQFDLPELPNKLYLRLSIDKSTVVVVVPCHATCSHLNGRQRCQSSMSSCSCCSYSASSAIHFSSSSSAAFSRTQVSYRILTWLPVWQFYIANASLLVCPSTPRSSLVPVVCIVPCTVQCNCKFVLCKLHCELHESCWWWWLLFWAESGQTDELADGGHTKHCSVNSLVYSKAMQQHKWQKRRFQ